MTIDPKSSPNKGSIYFLRIIMVIIPSLVSVAIEQYTPQGVYGEICPAFGGNIERVNYIYSINLNDVMKDMVCVMI